MARNQKRVSLLAGAFLMVAALFAGGCGGAVPHRLAAPPVAGSVQVDVLRAGAWQPIAETSWALETQCTLRVREARDGEVVRVRYAAQPGGQCTPSAARVGRLAAR